MDKDTHLNLRQVPEDLLPALESHLAELESTKKGVSQPRYLSSLGHFKNFIVIISLALIFLSVPKFRQRLKDSRS